MYSRMVLSVGTLLGYIALFMVSIPRVTAIPPDVTFLCGRMPEICTNICWANRCGDPAFPRTLTWDRPSDTTAGRRRRSAGCGSRNKCLNRNSPFYRGDGFRSCDEYPLASTANADAGSQVSRCVPPVQNSRQGQSLSIVLGRWRRQGLTRRSLKINLGNPGRAGVNFCGNQACVNDGFQIQDGQLKRQTAAVSKRQIDDGPRFLYYRTKAGMELASLDENEIGDKFWRELDDGEELPDGVETYQEGDIILFKDEIVEQIDGITFDDDAGAGNSTITTSTPTSANSTSICADPGPASTFSTETSADSTLAEYY